MSDIPVLTLDDVKNAVAGTAAAFRRVVRLQPAGGQGAKVFPPTYEGGKYATEKRRINGEILDCVLLDSVQSQANRMELALQEAIDEGRISIPLIVVDFSSTSASFIGKITSLEAPHRIADAILRDSKFEDAKGNKIPFRQSSAGEILNTASPQNATELFRYCPTALVFGMWDSTSTRGGIGVKFPRVIVSEIIGVGALPGQRTSSRLDPLQISSKAGPIYETTDGDWTLDPAKAKRKTDKQGKIVKDKNGNEILVLYGDKGNPSEINHGNVTPSLVVQKDKNGRPLDKSGRPTDRADEWIPIGGFTIDYALQITLISLPALRRLRFPMNGGNADLPGRVALTALALCAATLSAEKGYNLRSQCDLVPEDALHWELIGIKESKLYSLTSEQAIELFNKAVEEAKAAKLPWNSEPVKLSPCKDLVELVLRSR